MTTPEAATDIVLNETDRELIWMAARILCALDPGPTRLDAYETLVQAYRDDLGAAHVGTDHETLDEMTTGFGGALWLEMDRLGDDAAAVPVLRMRRAPERARVIEAIGRYLPMVDPRH